MWLVLADGSTVVADRKTLFDKGRVAPVWSENNNMQSKDPPAPDGGQRQARKRCSRTEQGERVPSRSWLGLGWAGAGLGLFAWGAPR